MKIRNGFISNSSSASFILTLNNTSYDDLSIFIREEILELYHTNNILEYIKDKEFLNELKKRSKEIYYKNKIKNLINLFLLFNTKTIDDFFKFYFEYFYNITFNKENENIKLKWWTSMLNDYSSSVPEIIKNILLYDKITNEFKCEIEVISED